VEILKFDSAPRPSRGKNKSASKALFAIVGVVALATLGSTLAGSITINSGQNVEFGQGVSVTASCDVTAGITLAPSATFINAVGTGTFSLGTIGFSGIDSTCAGKVFTLKAYDNVAGSSPLTLVTSGAGAGTAYNYATFAFTTPGATTKSSWANVGNYSAGSGSNGTIDLGWADTRTISATNTYKFTLESSAN
jgi:hypothetical protein